MKRSRQLTLTTLMAAGGVSLAACGGDAPATNWDAAAAADQGPAVDAYSYRTIEACKAANEVPDTACEDAGRIAIADQEKAAPRYDERKTCEEVYGEGQCVPRGQGGGSFWGPLITGFVVGQMLDGGWRGTGMYRDRYGAYHTGYGGRMWTDYSTGRTRIGARGIDPPDIVKQAPPKVQTRASVISRGGFGGRMSARSSGGRSFGG